MVRRRRARPTTSRTRASSTLSTACAPYFDWQSAGLGLSHRRVRQPGPLTRLIACSDAYYAARSLRVPHIGTHVHPDYGGARAAAVE